jgi:tetratricopeptide (TPR) repeat protein
MSLELDRLAEVVVTLASSRYSLGTAYRISSRYLLTAKHVVRGKGATPVDFQEAEIRFLIEGARYLPVKPCWESNDEDDLAILELTAAPKEVPNLSPVQWGQLARKESIGCKIAGFPRATKEYDQRESFGLRGVIDQYGGVKADRLQIDLPDIQKDEDLEELSGAPVFVEDFLVGVVQGRIPGFSRVWAQPVSKLYSTGQLLPPLSLSDAKLVVLDEIELMNRRKFEEFVEQFRSTFKTRTVHDAIATTITVADERKKADALIRQAEGALKQAGQQATPDNYYNLGMLYAAVGRFSDAAASFLAATAADPNMAQAYTGLAVAYQLQANEMIRQDNYGLAEEALTNAEKFAETAWGLNKNDPMIETQLGYIYKDLAQRYASKARQDKTEEYVTLALKHFKRALVDNENDVSALNGIGSVYLIRKDYDKAIDEIRKVTELEPRYLYALFDLCIAYYGKATVSQDLGSQGEALLRFVETWHKISDLESERSAGSLPPGAQQSLSDMLGWVLQQMKSITEQVKKITNQSASQGQDLLEAGSP